MSSVDRSGKSFAAKRTPVQPNQQFLNTGGYEPHAFQLSDINSACNSTTGFNQVSESLYIAQNRSALEAALSTLNGLTSSDRVTNNEVTLIDLGKSIRIGITGGSNDLVTFRLVKRTGNKTSGGLPNLFPNVCYVVTGSKVSLNYNSALYPSVLGCAPNARSKQQFISTAGYEPAIFTLSDLQTAFSTFTQVSGSLYIANNASDLANAMTSLNTYVNYAGLSSTETSVVDLGKSIRVGLAGGENDIVVLRLVKRTGNVTSSGEANGVPQVGYIVIANKMGQVYRNGLYVGALGTSPNALQNKPQFVNNGGYRPAIFTLADLQSAFANCLQVSDSLFLATSSGQLQSVCSGLNNSTGPFLPENEASSVELGRTIRLGLVGGESDLLTFALVKRTGTVISDGEPGGVPAVGYVVVANKLSQAFNDALYVSTLGTAPSDS